MVGGWESADRKSKRFGVQTVMWGIHVAGLGLLTSKQRVSSFHTIKVFSLAISIPVYVNLRGVGFF